MVAMTAGEVRFSGRHVLLAAVGTASAAALVTALIIAADRRARRRKSRRLAINILSPYAEAALKEAAALCGFAVDADAPCEWADFSTLDWDVLLAGDNPLRRASCFYTRAGLVRKAMLAHHLEKQKKRETRNGIDNSFVEVLPPSLVVDLEDEADLEALQRRLSEWEKRQPPDLGHPSWVAKASVANRGENIFLASTVNEIIEALRPAALNGGVVEWVIQRYVSPPMLLNGCKFHVRAHFLVSGCPHCGTTRASLHREHHTVLVATAPYSSCCESRSAHLTNHCIQASNPEYDENRQILLLSELDAAAARPGLADFVLERMGTLLTRALAAAAAAPAGFTTLPQCFELFGADFILDDRGANELPGVWLLEVNAGPDLAIFGERLHSHCVALLTDVIRVAVEPYVSRECGAGSLPFVDAASCVCSRSARETGFTNCLWSAAPRTASATEELIAFKRRFGTAARWAKALHEGSSVAVRGPQGRSNNSGS